MEHKITAGTIARTIVLLLALVNQCLSMAGIQVINTLVTTLWTVVAAVVAWWKNNSFSKAALDGDALMRQEKGA